MDDEAFEKLRAQPRGSLAEQADWIRSLQDEDALNEALCIACEDGDEVRRILVLQADWIRSLQDEDALNEALCIACEDGDEVRRNKLQEGSELEKIFLLGHAMGIVDLAQRLAEHLSVEYKFDLLYGFYRTKREAGF